MEIRAVGYHVPVMTWISAPLAASGGKGFIQVTTNINWCSGVSQFLRWIKSHWHCD